jgi:hypothetical protein
MSPRSWIDTEVGVSKGTADLGDPRGDRYKKQIAAAISRLGLKLDPVETQGLIDEAYASAQAVVDGSWQRSGKDLPPEILELLKKFQ